MGKTQSKGETKKDQPLDKAITNGPYTLTLERNIPAQNISMHAKNTSYVFLNFSQEALKLNDKLLAYIENCNEILGPYEKRKDLEDIFLSSERKDVTITGIDTFYVGEWNSGFQCGFGHLFMNKSVYYIGYLYLGKPFGHGRMVYEDGSFYEQGEWFLGLPYRSGVFYASNGDIEFTLKQKQIEDFVMNEPSIIVNNQSVYYGELKNGQKIGFGLQLWEDGTSYIGEFDNDQRNGVGMMKFSNGNSYMGEYKNNCMEGIGLFKWKDNRFYLGRYYQNHKNGFGIWKFNEYQKYIGYFRLDQLNGRIFKFDQLRNKKQIEFWKENVQLTQVEVEIFGFKL